MTPFQDTIAALRGVDYSFEALPDENWFQGRTVFGGLVAALALEAIRRGSTAMPQLRTAQFAFTGPASGLLKFTPRMLREGRSSSFVAVDVASDGKLVTTAFFTFAEARTSKHRIDTLPMPPAPPPESGVALFEMHGAPRSTSNFDGRLVGGQIPFTGAPAAELLLWLRHKDSPAVSGEKALIALADASPPAVYPLFEAPAPVSTVNWTVDFNLAHNEASEWYLVRTHSDLVSDGYSQQSTTIWTSAGVAVVTSRQLIALYS